MSSKLVRKLFQQTSDYDLPSSPSENAEPKKSRKRQHDDLSPTLAKDEVMNHQVQSLLFLDKSMASRVAKKNVTLSRIRHEHQNASKTREKISSMVVGNSRSSASQLVLAPEPTFNKKKYKAKKKRKRLDEIAKLLRKGAKQSSKKA